MEESIDKNAHYSNALKSQNAYKFANEKIMRFNRELEFVREFLRGKSPTREEWKDFFMDLIRIYNLGGRKLPEISIESPDGIDFTIDNSHNSDVYAWYENDTKKIVLNDAFVDLLSKRVASILDGIDTLMHEFRHFYQYEATYEQFGSEYKRIMGVDYIPTSRSLQVPSLSRSKIFETACNLIHSAVKENKYFAGLVSLEGDDKINTMNYMAFVCYYNLPHEVDARATADSLTDLIFDDFRENLDEVLQLEFEKQYAKMIRSYENKTAGSIHRKYYNAFEKEIKDLSVEDLGKIGENIKKDNGDLINIKAYQGILGIYLKDKKTSERLEFLESIVKTNYNTLFEYAFKIIDLTDEEKKEFKNDFLNLLKENKIKSGYIFSTILCKHDIFSSKETYEVFNSLLDSENYSFAQIAYSQLLLLGYDEKFDFNYKIIKKLKSNAKKVFLKQDIIENLVKNAKYIKAFLILILSDGFVPENSEELQLLIESLSDFIDTYEDSNQLN